MILMIANGRMIPTTRVRCSMQLLGTNSLFVSYYYNLRSLSSSEARGDHRSSCSNLLYSYILWLTS